MVCCSNWMAVPAVHKFLQRLINPRQKNIVHCPKVVFIQVVKDTMLFQKIKQFVIGASLSEPHTGR